MMNCADVFLPATPHFFDVDYTWSVNIQLAIFQRTVTCYRMRTDFR